MEKEKVLILLFSGTGNTRAVGAMIAGHFRDKGFSVEKLEIKNPFPEIKDPDDYRYIGFGYPVHARIPTTTGTSASAIPSTPSTSRGSFAVFSPPCRKQARPKRSYLRPRGNPWPLIALLLSCWRGH